MMIALIAIAADLALGDIDIDDDDDDYASALYHSLSHP